MVREKLTVERKSFGFRLNVQLIDKLKILAITQHKAVNVIMEEAVEDLINKYQGNQGRKK